MSVTLVMEEGVGDRQIHGKYQVDSRPVSLAKIVSPRFSNKSCPKRIFFKIESKKVRHSTSVSGPYIGTEKIPTYLSVYTTYTYVHTHAEYIIMLGFNL